MSRMIQIRNVPDDVHRRLKSRAALAGLSMSDYVLRTAYDAAYVALAEVVGGPLLTTDARLSKAPGLPIPVELFDTRTIH